MMMRLSIPNGRRRRTVTAKLLAESIAGKSCPICLCRVVERTAAVVIPCNHAYCFECIRRWSNLKRSCPICNSEFDSWFFELNLASKTFRWEKLPVAPVNDKVRSVAYSRRRRWVAERSRIRMEDLEASRSRTRPLPWRRSFSRARDEHPDVIAERVLLWRSSVYEQQLQAVPISSKDSLLQKISTNNDAKKLVLQRIEPWIKRELQGILGDPDPCIIVHVATSLFISMHESKYEGTSGQSDVVDLDFLSPLRPFLLEKTKMFWHELRCFAECSYSMETYDRVVEYSSRLPLEDA